MSRPVKITPLAEADITKAHDDYESREPGLGNRFVGQVRSTLTRIGQNPFQYQVVQGTREHRRPPVRQFPYGLWYRIEPDESVVVACLAHRADPALAGAGHSKSRSHREPDARPRTFRKLGPERWLYTQALLSNLVPPVLVAADGLGVVSNGNVLRLS